jgi:pSer/pThr/pTyr-binding forkhead associated (FHA) protein
MGTISTSLGQRMKAELVPLNGDPPIPITRDLTVVGRKDYCDVRIKDDSLSKRHCVLVRTDGLLMIRDLASTNGTKVNGQKVLWAALLPNDRLTLGHYKLRVYLGPDHLPGPSESGAGGEVPRRKATAASGVGVTLGFVSQTPVGMATFPDRDEYDEDVLDGNDLVVDEDSDEGPAVIELD